jgi:hypothetical protein
LLRLAILLHQGRDADAVVEPEIKANKFMLELVFPDGYLDSRAMTVLNLESEKNLFDVACYDLNFK